MGRHSASDDEERTLPARLPLPESRPRPGRHYRPDDEENRGELLHLVAERVAERVTERLPEAPPARPEAPPGQPTEPAAAPKPAAAPESAQRDEPAAAPAEPEPAEPVELAEPAESTSTELVLAEPAERKVVAEISKGNHPTSADLELLRRHSDLRARVIAAVVVPFVIYTAVMYLIAALPVYFIWVWIPLVTAGVLAGSLLDSAHRRNARESARDDEPGAE